MAQTHDDYSEGNKLVKIILGILFGIVAVGVIVGVSVYFGVTSNIPDCDIPHCSYCHEDGCLECEKGWFGFKCDNLCGNCTQAGCDKVSGLCQECYPGFYGTFCRKRCPDDCGFGHNDRKSCHRSTGKCLECQSGLWGDNCTSHCGKRCTNGTCLKEDGSCNKGCQDGWYGNKCNDNCDENCHRCNQSTSVCTKCSIGYKEPPACKRDCHNCEDDICGYTHVPWYSSAEREFRCTSGCKKGWTSHNCTERCSRRCKDRICDTDGDCISCITGLYGPKCMLRCQVGCASHCSGSTGSCVCKDGFYGSQCQHECSWTCAAKCHRYSASCDSCKDGFYGPQCQHECSSTCSKCDKKTGSCDSCNEGYFGPQCQEPCPESCKEGKCKMDGTCSGLSPSCGTPMCHMIMVCIGMMTALLLQSGWSD